MSDDEYQRLLDQLPQKLFAVMSWKKYLGRLIQAGRKTGRTDLEIGDDIREKLRGQLDDSTVRRYLPISMKHEEKTNKADARILRASPPYIPAPPQPIVDIEPEPPKAIPTGDRKIKLDTAKFRSDLRIALINGDKVWLKYNSDNEVISIIEM
jgi:hypothetical protein